MLLSKPFVWIYRRKKKEENEYYKKLTEKRKTGDQSKLEQKTQQKVKSYTEPYKSKKMPPSYVKRRGKCKQDSNINEVVY